MFTQPVDAVSKIHPATREMLPEDPMEMHAVEVPGDPVLMLRLLVEEYGRMGFDAAAIMRLARDPNYQAFHGLLKFFGETELSTRVSDILSRCGIMRVTTREAPLPPTELVQIQMFKPG
jgi:hypothetical protein